MKGLGNIIQRWCRIWIRMELRVNYPTIQRENRLSLLQGIEPDLVPEPSLDPGDEFGDEQVRDKRWVLGASLSPLIQLSGC